MRVKRWTTFAKSIAVVLALIALVLCGVMGCGAAEEADAQSEEKGEISEGEPTPVYCVCFVADGEESKKYVKEGEAVTRPDDPVKQKTAQYSYAFDGWYDEDGYLFDFSTRIYGDVVLTAAFTPSLNKCAVSFKVGGETADATLVDYGSAVTPPAAPTKPATAAEVYEFIGWFEPDATEAFDLSAVVSDVVLVARFDAKPRKYKVAFDADGAEDIYVEYNSKAVRPADPVKEADAQYTYSFIGWFAGASETEFDFDTRITAAVTLTARFDKGLRSYAVAFYIGEAEPVIESVAYGTVAVPPTVAAEWSDGEVRFVSHWTRGSEAYDFAPITGETELAAAFDTAPIGETESGEYAMRIETATVGADVCACDTRLAAVYLSETITEIEPNAFSGCAALKSMEVAPTNAVYASSGNCIIDKSTGEVVAACANAVVPETATAIAAGAFMGSGMSAINIPSNITSIGSVAFNECASLKYVYVGRGVQSIGEEVFSGCTSLERVILPSGITVAASTLADIQGIVEYY